MSAKEDKGKEKGIKARLLVGKFPLGDRFEFFTFITCEMHVGGTLLRRGPFNFFILPLSLLFYIPVFI
jgi:hypothetical protein